MMPTMYRRRWMIVLFFTLSFFSLFWWFSNFHKNIANIDMGGEIYVKGDNYNVIEEYSVASSKQQQQRFEIDIPSNKNSSYVRSDISKIVHVPTESRIEIHLKTASDRRCQNPVFKGRISGWSLSVIDFDTPTTTTTTTTTMTHGGEGDNDLDDGDDGDHDHNDTTIRVIVGTYHLSQMPTSGTYYVEILVLFCERYNNDERFLFDLDLSTVCLENTQEANNFRITAGDGSASIHIEVGEENYYSSRSDKNNRKNNQERPDNKDVKKFPSARGIWLHKSLLKSSEEVVSQQVNDEGSTRKLTKPKKTKHTKKARTASDLPQSETGSDSLVLDLREPLLYKTKPNPLYTMYQNVFRESQQYHRFDDYTFRWEPGPYELLNEPGLSLLQLLPANKTNTKQHHHQEHDNNNQTTHICFVGESHSRFLRIHCELLLKQTQTKLKQTEHVETLRSGIGPRGSSSTTPFLSCSAIKARYPSSISKALHWIIELGCTHVVVGFFQHFFTIKEKEEEDGLAANGTLSYWKAQMSDVIKILQTTAMDQDNSLQKIVVRSVHANGLKLDMIQCPAKDFRHPLNADLATVILKQIVEESNHQRQTTTTTNSTATNPATRTTPPEIVSFLDTNFLLGPVWDAQSDWNHFRGKEGVEEAKFILSYILSGDRQQPLNSSEV